jgi:hypothetical protein
VPSRRKRDKLPPRDFDFFRYEVWFGIAIGMLIATILAPLFYPILFLVSLVGVSWGLTHLVGRAIVRRRMDSRLAREEQDERERRAVAARSAASLENEQASHTRRRRQRRRG